MIYGMENAASTKCALDSKKYEAFTQKSFSELIYAAHAQGQDYYIARIQCGASENSPSYYCYDAKHLCKFIFEMMISGEGRKIRIKNFVDPIHGKEISEITYFKMRYESDTPLKAEYAGSHMNFLESSVFRSKIFYNEDPLEALSVNFQFKSNKREGLITKKRFMMFLGLTMLLAAIGLCSYLAVKYTKTISEKHQSEKAVQKDKSLENKTSNKKIQKAKKAKAVAKPEAATVARNPSTKRAVPAPEYNRNTVLKRASRPIDRH